MKSEWQNQKILVAGMGGSGISMLAFLRRKGAVVAAYDADFPAVKQTELQQRFPGLACHTGYLKSAGWLWKPTSKISKTAVISNSSKSAKIAVPATLNLLA